VIVQERDARIQLPFHWLPLLALKGKADGGYRTTMQRKVVVEVKSTNEKGWSRAVGLWEGSRRRRRRSGWCRAAWPRVRRTIDAQLLHIVLCDSERVGEVAEWWVDVDEPLDLADWPADVDVETGEKVLPTVRSMVRAELWRQAEVLAKCEQGTLPARVVPNFGLVMVPPANDERGEPWQCRFCPFQPSCSRLSPNDVEDYGEMASWTAYLTDDRGHDEGQWNYTHNCNGMANAIVPADELRAGALRWWGRRGRADVVERSRLTPTGAARGGTVSTRWRGPRAPPSSTGSSIGG
jgi:hypothetical protein